MNNKCNELTRNHAQSLTRGTAIHRAGLGLAGMALACFGLANKGNSQTGCLPAGSQCIQNSECCSGHCKWIWWGSLGADKHKEKFWFCA